MSSVGMTCEDGTALSTVQYLNRSLDNARRFIDSAIPQARAPPAFSTCLQGFRLPQLPKQRRRVASSTQQQQRKDQCQGRVTVPSGRFAALIPGDGVLETVFTSGIGSFFGLYQAVLISRLVLTWFPNPPMQLVGPLSTITDPYLNLFRGLIPPIGGTIDLSPILAFITLDVFSNSAAALPCEIDSNGQPVIPAKSNKAWSPARSIAAWRQGLTARRVQMQQNRKPRQA